MEESAYCKVRLLARSISLASWALAIAVGQARIMMQWHKRLGKDLSVPLTGCGAVWSHA